MSLRVQGIAQWESCAASFFSIPANILLLGKSLNCLYLSQFLTDFHFLKRHLNAIILDYKYTNVDLFFTKSESKRVELTIKKNRFGLETVIF